MSGPVPKPPELKQRRNRESTAATLSTPENPVVPKLKAPDGRKWHKATKEWWDDVWHSPMAGEYIATDVWGLARIAVLVDDFNKSADQKLRKELMVEIRLQEQRFGLSSIDRRRLQWEIKRVQEPAKPAQKRPERLVDPRAVLKSVQ